MGPLSLLPPEDRPHPAALALLALGGLAALLAPSALVYQAVLSAQGTAPQAIAGAVLATPFGGTSLLLFVCIVASLRAALSHR